MTGQGGAGGRVRKKKESEVLIIETEPKEAKQLVRGDRNKCHFQHTGLKSWETEIPSCGQIHGSELSAKV